MRRTIPPAAGAFAGAIGSDCPKLAGGSSSVVVALRRVVTPRCVLRAGEGVTSLADVGGVPYSSDGGDDDDDVLVLDCAHDFVRPPPRLIFI